MNILDIWGVLWKDAVQNFVPTYLKYWECFQQHFHGVIVYNCARSSFTVMNMDIRGCIQKFPDWVNKEINNNNNNNNNKHSLRSNTKDYGVKIHWTDSQNSDTLHLVAASMETFGHTLIYCAFQYKYVIFRWTFTYQIWQVPSAWPKDVKQETVHHWWLLSDWIGKSPSTLKWHTCKNIVIVHIHCSDCWLGVIIHVLGGWEISDTLIFHVESILIYNENI
jgi:hypothetical protein